jgi:SAM-dependent methyltransferase
MNPNQLLNREELENSSVVANCCMNRERDLLGSNGYEVEIGFDPLQWCKDRLESKSIVRWLDICCGTGKALIQAASIIETAGLDSIQIIGVDLVDMFLPHESTSLCLSACSIFDFETTTNFDLITCVHGLHYVGDKLQAIKLATSWLAADGLFVANLDQMNLRLSKTQESSKSIIQSLRDRGFEYNSRKHLLRIVGFNSLDFPYRFEGADDSAGPNYTKQPAVTSYYRLAK